MRKQNIIFLLLFCSFTVLNSSLHAQGGLWSHMHGSIGSGAQGLYGTKGVANPTNTPSGRYQGAYWTDLNGNFWMFGGFHPWGYANDLWKYDVATNQWTWMNGPQSITDQNGEFGTMGVPSANNYPSARTFGPNCWTDNNGDLWLYGGFGYDVNGAQGGLSDLWRYNIATNQWTWINGSNLVNVLPVYGTQGVPSPTNHPGARAECKSGWVDPANNLWLFGGQDGATASTTINVRNDLWKYDIATNQWTWMKGSNALNAIGSYGTKGVEAATNNPPARLSFTKWKGKDNQFYVFAGGNSATARNDVWRYNPATNNWTWISGTSAQGNSGTYNAHCAPLPNTYPSARIENQTVATMGCTEVFWSFGGFKTITNTESFNDLWLFNSSTSDWTWVSGGQTTNAIGNFGPLGSSLPTNMISSRGGVFIWSDMANNLWIFGGLAYDSSINQLGLKNDLWRFVPDSTCFGAGFQSVLDLIGPADTLICIGDSTMMDVPQQATIIITPSTGYVINSDSTQIQFGPQATTTYTITGKDPGICAGKDTLIFTITVLPEVMAEFTLSPTQTLTTAPLFTLTNNSQNATSYQWIYNGNVFSTSQDASYTATDTGTYCFTLVATNIENCSDTVTHCGTVVFPDHIFVPSAFSPNTDLINNEFHIIGSNITLKRFEVYSRWGEKVFSTKDISKGWDGTYKNKPCEMGTYFYLIEYEGYKNNTTEKEKKLLKGDVNLIR